MDTSYAWQDGWEQAWQPMIDAIGRDFSKGPMLAADDIERGAVRRYCEPLEFDCPLHYDEAVARQHGYRGIVAPASGIPLTWSESGQWQPGDRTRYTDADPNATSSNNVEAYGVSGAGFPDPPTNGGFLTDIEVEYFEPLCVGDRLTTRGLKLLSVTPRETRVGRGAFRIVQKEFVNQRGELVAQIREGNYSYVTRPAGATANDQRAAAGPPAGPIMEATPLVLPLPAPRTVDWSEQLYFEDLHEGDLVPPVVMHLTVFRLVVEAGANRDFSNIHHNTVVAQRGGAPDMYANNIFIQGWWERTVREHIGLAGRIKKVGPFRMAIFNTVGESVITSGTVKRKWVEGGEHLVELELRSEHSKGVSVGPGPVLVSLPSRGGVGG